MQTYRHSGAIPIVGALMSVALGMTAALVGGFVYAYAFWWIPIIYLNFLMTLAFPALIGGAVYYGGHVGKVRNTVFSVVVGVLCSLFGLWVYWGAYAWALGGAEIGLFAWSPDFQIAFAQHLFEKGSWGLSDNTPVTGWFLVAIWVVEAGVILTVAFKMSALDAKTAFCENCRQWANEEKGVARLDSDGSEPVWTEIAQGNLVGLADFKAAPTGSCALHAAGPGKLPAMHAQPVFDDPARDRHHR